MKLLSSTTVWLKNIFAFAIYLNSAPSAPSLWNICYYFAANVRQHGVASGSSSISYFQLFGKIAKFDWWIWFIIVMASAVNSLFRMQMPNFSTINVESD